MPSRGELSNGQDWGTVSFGSKSSKSGGSTPRAGGGSGTTPRGPGSAATTSGKSAAALEADTENYKHETVSTDLKRALSTARTAKGMTQKQLAQALVMDAKTVQEYEQGKAIPNNAVIAKMEKALGVKLPRAPKK